MVERAARNMEWVKVVHVANLNVKDLIEAEVVLLSEKGLETINKRFQKDAKGEAQTPAKPKATTKKAAGEKKAKAAKPAKEAKPKAKDEAPKAKKTTKKSES